MRLLTDHEGKLSTMRRASLACALTACAAVLLPMLGPGQTPDLGTLGALLGGGLGAKVWQSDIERRPRAPRSGGLES